MNPKDNATFQDKEYLGKKFYLSVPEKQAADLMIKLGHESIPVRRFFRLMIEGYLKDDKRILSFLDEASKGYRNNYQTQILVRERLKLKEVKDTFGLDSDEIKDIYDIMEEELDDYR